MISLGPRNCRVENRFKIRPPAASWSHATTAFLGPHGAGGLFFGADMTYSEKLRHPSWQRKRLEIMGEHGFRCSRCGGDQRELHVHHKFYLPNAEPWEYPANAYSVLCDMCHKAEGATIREYEALYRRFRMEGGSLRQLIGYLKGLVRPPLPPEDGEELDGLASAMTIFVDDHEMRFAHTRKFRAVRVEITREWDPT
jgi:hypothetical protein